MFKKEILDNQVLIQNITLKKRDYTFYDDLLKLNKIVSFVWPRRVGKTFLMFQFVQELISQWKLSLKQIIFIDFSLYSGQNIDPTQILLDYQELFPDQKPFFVFDEIQDINNFKEFVLRLFNSRHHIFLSGSNSKLLSSELTTHFRGRIFEYQILPLTFKEVLNFNNLKIQQNHSTQQKSLINKIFHNSLNFGTFPEIVLSKNDLFKLDNLRTYLDILIYKDIIERYKLANEFALKYLLKSLALWFTKNINISKIYNELKSQNISVGKSTIFEYYEYTKNIFYIQEIENFFKPKASKKTYLYNLWFSKLLGKKENLGQSFENTIFWELKKKYKKIFFKKWKIDIDFYIEEINTNFQICYELNIKNLNREILPLKNNDAKNILIYWQKKDLWVLDGTILYLSFFEFINKFIEIKNDS